MIGLLTDGVTQGAQGAKETVSLNSRNSLPSVQFGASPVAEAGKDVVKIAHVGIAEKGYGFFGKYLTDVRRFNLSQEDWMSRSNVLISVYIPQAIGAFVEHAHQIETNVRNGINWFAAIFLTLFTKNEKFGVNSMLDVFMQQKRTAYESASLKLEKLQNNLKSASAAQEKTFHQKISALKKWRVQRKATKLQNKVTVASEKLKHLDPQSSGSLRHRVSNKLRMNHSYLDILKEANVKTSSSDRFVAKWSKLDSNEISLIQQYHGRLAEELKKTQDATDKAKIEKKLSQISGFLRRLILFKLVSVGVATALNIYLMGKLITNLVMKYIAPLDKDYEGPNKKAPKPALSTPSLYSTPLQQSHFYGQPVAHTGTTFSNLIPNNLPGGYQQ